VATKIDGGLRKLFRENLPDFFWTSVETGGTARGVPDANYLKNGTEGWIEYKWTKRWTPKSFEPEQVAWHLRRAREGGRSFIAVRRQCAVGPRTAAADELYLFRGADAGLVRAEGLRGSCAPLLQFAGGPARWSWDEVRRVLLEG
jgi:hypothetical protein